MPFTQVFTKLSFIFCDLSLKGLGGQLVFVFKYFRTGNQKSTINCDIFLYLIQSFLPVMKYTFTLTPALAFSFFSQSSSGLINKKIVIRPYLKNKKDHLFNIEKSLDIHLLVVLCSLQIAYPFQDKSYAIYKIIKVMFFLLRNSSLFSKGSTFCCGLLLKGSKA
jgi:hypothetical protein